MFLRILKFLVLLFSLALLLSGSALANTCNNFASYTCAHSTPNIVHVGGNAGTGFSVGTLNGLITGNSFTLSFSNPNASAAGLIVIAAFLNTAPAGTLNGVSFTGLSSFPEGGATGAIVSTLQGLGLCSTTCNLSFGYVLLPNSALAPGGSLTVNISGLPVGTVLYGMALDSNGKIIYITPNSEAGVYKPPPQIPEPGTLTLLGTGLLSLAGLLRRKLSA